MKIGTLVRGKCSYVVAFATVLFLVYHFLLLTNQVNLSAVNLSVLEVEEFILALISPH